jgi:hypothetical protein
MAIYFANEEGTWRTQAGTPIQPDSMDMGIVYNTQISTSSLSKYVKTYELPGARWKIRLSYSNLQPEEARPLLAWLADLRGAAGRFYIYDFSLPTPLGGLSSANFTLSDASTINLTSMVGGTLEVGDLFTIYPNSPYNTIPELKMVTNVIDANSFNFEPVCRRPYTNYTTDNSLHLGTTAYAHMMLTSDEQAFHSVQGKVKLSTITIDAIEVFNNA